MRYQFQAGTEGVFFLLIGVTLAAAAGDPAPVAPPQGLLLATAQDCQNFVHKIKMRGNPRCPSSAGYTACQLLGRLGLAASSAIPALGHCIGLDGSEEDLIRWLGRMASEAISKITGDPTAALSVATDIGLP